MARQKKRPRSTSQHTPNAYRRATYYLRPEQIKALKLRAVTEERNLSAVMREAVDRYLRRVPEASRR